MFLNTGAAGGVFASFCQVFVTPWLFASPLGTVALLDALEAGLCKDRGAVIVDVDVWYTDYIWGEEEENNDYKKAGDVLRAARALQTQTLKDEINIMSGRLKGVEQDLRIIKTKLGAATPEETKAV